MRKYTSTESSPFYFLHVRGHGGSAAYCNPCLGFAVACWNHLGYLNTPRLPAHRSVLCVRTLPPFAKFPCGVYLQMSFLTLNLGVQYKTPGTIHEKPDRQYQPRFVLALCVVSHNCTSVWKTSWIERAHGDARCIRSEQ